MPYHQQLMLLHFHIMLLHLLWKQLLWLHHRLWPKALDCFLVASANQGLVWSCSSVRRLHRPSSCFLVRQHWHAFSLLADNVPPISAHPHNCDGDDSPRIWVVARICHSQNWNRDCRAHFGIVHPLDNGSQSSQWPGLPLLSASPKQLFRMFCRYPAFRFSLNSYTSQPNCKATGKTLIHQTEDRWTWVGALQTLCALEMSWPCWHNYGHDRKAPHKKNGMEMLP